ncbi:MAG: haloacid dehalogenase-like hydrolase, partial [bacterium]
INDQVNFEKLIQVFVGGGPENMHILSDFDRTLTYALVNGQKSPSIIAQLRNGDYLSKEYSSEAHALFNTYHCFETDPELSRAERSAKMQEWWDKHHKLLIKSGLTRRAMDEVVAKSTLKFREGALSLFDLTKQNNIPLIIMSAGPGYMIAKYLEQEKRLYDNVHIIANWYEFDDSGNMIGIKEPVIHSLNKYEIVVKEYPIFETIKNRKNVLLMGDGIDDVGMIEGFEYDNLLKIGFLNDGVEKNLDKFTANFDVVITRDSGMEYVDKLLQRILKKFD